MRKRATRQRGLAGPASLAALAIALLAPGLASAKPPAPGGARRPHTWAPADKHGFGTATRPREPRLVHAALGRADRGLLPRSRHPQPPRPRVRRHRRGQLHRPRDRRGRRQPGDADTGLAGLPSGDPDRPLAARKTWIADPERDTVAGPRAIRVAHRGAASALSARRSGARRRRQRRPRPQPRQPPGRFRRHGRHASPRARPSGPRPAATRGSDSDPWTDLSARLRSRRRVRRRRAGQRRAGGAHRADRRRRTPQTDDARHRLWPGPARRERERQPGALRGRLRRGRAALRCRLGPLPGSLNEPPASVAADAPLRRALRQSLMVLEASEDKTYRGASIASPSMPWVWGTLTLAATENSGPYHLVWPRDLYHVATAQQALGDDGRADPAAGLPLARPEARRLLVAEHRGRRHRHWDDHPARRGLAADRPGLVARPHERRRTGSTCAPPRTTWSRTGPRARRSAGRTRTAGRRTRSRPRSRA